MISATYIICAAATTFVSLALPEWALCGMYIALGHVNIVAMNHDLAGLLRAVTLGFMGRLLWRAKGRPKFILEMVIGVLWAYIGRFIREWPTSSMALAQPDCSLTQGLDVASQLAAVITTYMLIFTLPTHAPNLFRYTWRTASMSLTRRFAHRTSWTLYEGYVAADWSETSLSVVRSHLVRFEPVVQISNAKSDHTLGLDAVSGAVVLRNPRRESSVGVVESERERLLSAISAGAYRILGIYTNAVPHNLSPWGVPAIAKLALMIEWKASAADKSGRASPSAEKSISTTGNAAGETSTDEQPLALNGVPLPSTPAVPRPDNAHIEGLARPENEELQDEIQEPKNMEELEAKRTVNANGEIKKNDETKTAGATQAEGSQVRPEIAIYGEGNAKNKDVCTGQAKPPSLNAPNPVGGYKDRADKGAQAAPESTLEHRAVHRGIGREVDCGGGEGSSTKTPVLVKSEIVKGGELRDQGAAREVKHAMSQHSSNASPTSPPESIEPAIAKKDNTRRVFARTRGYRRPGDAPDHPYRRRPGAVESPVSGQADQSAEPVGRQEGEGGPSVPDITTSPAPAETDVQLAIHSPEPTGSGGGNEAITQEQDELPIGANEGSATLGVPVQETQEEGEGPIELEVAQVDLAVDNLGNVIEVDTLGGPTVDGIDIGEAQPDAEPAAGPENTPLPLWVAPALEPVVNGQVTGDPIQVTLPKHFYNSVPSYFLVPTGELACAIALNAGLALGKFPHKPLPPIRAVPASWGSKSAFRWVPPIANFDRTSTADYYRKFAEDAKRRRDTRMILPWYEQLWFLPKRVVPPIPAAWLALAGA